MYSAEEKSSCQTRLLSQSYSSIRLPSPPPVLRGPMDEQGRIRWPFSSR
jgi:hypothetical protein